MLIDIGIELSSTRKMLYSALDSKSFVDDMLHRRDKVSELFSFPALKITLGAEATFRCRLVVLMLA